MVLVEQLLEELKDNRGLIVELQRVLNIDDLEDKIDELDSLSQKQNIYPEKCDRFINK